MVSTSVKKVHYGLTGNNFNLKRQENGSFCPAQPLTLSNQMISFHFFIQFRGIAFAKREVKVKVKGNKTAQKNTKKLIIDESNGEKESAF